MRNYINFLLVCLLTVQVAVAQQTVSGSVTDESGIPLPGATVIEKGTRNGTASDFDGNYSISVGPNAWILRTSAKRRFRCSLHESIRNVFATC
jgi:iron complex outermembrane receptor protein